MRPRIDYQRSLEIGTIARERPKGPKEGAFGELLTRSMLADQSTMEQGKIAGQIRAKETKRRNDLKKRKVQARMMLNQRGKNRNASSGSLRALLELRKQAIARGSARKISISEAGSGPMVVPTIAPMAAPETQSTTDSTATLPKTTSNAALSLVSGFGFAFGQKTKQKKNAKAENEVTQQEFEQHCYDAVKRVQQNQAEEAKQQKAAIAKVGQDGIEVEIDKDLEDFEDPQNNVKKAILEY